MITKHAPGRSKTRHAYFAGAFYVEALGFGAALCLAITKPAILL
jgi:hypothetical protein